MEVEATDINTDDFLPTKSQKRNQNKGKKRTISSTTANNDDDEQMQVDEISGIEGAAKTNMPKKKRKKQAAVEIRKVAVPSHR